MGLISYMETDRIKPIAKIPFPKYFNDFRPVALTSNIMKCLENIVRNLLCDRMEIFRDQMQFVYCRNRSVQDAGLTYYYITVTPACVVLVL